MEEDKKQGREEGKRRSRAEAIERISSAPTPGAVISRLWDTLLLVFHLNCVLLGFQVPGHVHLPVRAERPTSSLQKLVNTPGTIGTQSLPRRVPPGNTNRRASVPVAATAQTGQARPAPSVLSLGTKPPQGMFWIAQGQDVRFSLWGTRSLAHHFYTKIDDSASDHMHSTRTSQQTLEIKVSPLPCVCRNGSFLSTYDT